MDPKSYCNKTAPRVGLSRLMVVIACGALLASAVTIIVRYAVESSKENMCRAQLELIGRRLQYYRDQEGCFPPTSIVDANGRPMHSWRVLLVPYLESNWFFDRYKLDEPWDGPNNQQLLRACYEQSGDLRRDITVVRERYQCPTALASASEFRTDYVMVVDPSKPLLAISARSLNSYAKQGWQAFPSVGGELMIVEIHDSGIHWMEPRDLSLLEVSVLINDSSEASIPRRRVGRSLLLMLDGTVQSLDEERTRERLQDMLRNY